MKIVIQAYLPVADDIEGDCFHVVVNGVANRMTWHEMLELRREIVYALDANRKNHKAIRERDARFARRRRPQP